MKKLTKAITKLVAGVSATAIMAMTSVSAVEIKTFSEDLSVYLNGQNVYAGSTNKPFIINDRTLVPLRPIFESMGLGSDSVKWYPDEKKATFSDGKTVCEFVNESTKVTRSSDDGEIKGLSLDVPATIYNGNFYIPLRAFCELWDMNIVWNNTARRVDVNGNISNGQPIVNNKEFSFSNFMGEWNNISGMYLAQHLDIAVKLISVDEKNHTIDLQYKYDMDSEAAWTGGKTDYKQTITVPYHEENVRVQTGYETYAFKFQDTKALVTDIIEVKGNNEEISAPISGETVLTRFKLAAIEYNNSLYWATPDGESYYEDNRCNKIN